MGVYLPNKRLPDTYQEVEYIQSSGTQYINTGFIPDNNSKLELSMGGWNNGNLTGIIFGVRSSWSTNASTGRGFLLAGGISQDTWYGGMFGRRYSGSGDNFNVFNFVDGGDYILALDQSGFYQNGTKKYTPATVTFTSPSSIYLFMDNDNGTANEPTSYKLYYCKIWDNGTLVRNFIPCYRKSDSVIGLYDLVNNQFYTNSGSGTFSKGADVVMTELKNAYIGEVYEYSYDFRNKSVAGMQSDGWQFNTTSTITIDSNGISHPTTGLLRFAKQIPDISSAKKITYYITVISPSSGTCYAFCRMGKTLPSGNGTVSNYTGIYASLQQNNYQLEKNGTYTTGSTFTPRYSATFQIKTEIDLVNKTIKWTLGDTVNTSTLTDTEVNSIKTFRYIQPGCEATGMYVRDLLLTVE